MPAIPLKPEGEIPLNSGRTTIQPGGLMLFGPFDPSDEPLVARIVMRSGEGSVAAELVCEEDARRAFKAYLSEQYLPPIGGLDHAVVVGEKGRVDLSREDSDCPLVLMVRPPTGQKTAVTLEWTVFHPGAGPKPIVSCPDAHP